MNAISVVFTISLSVILWLSPRRYAAIPLLLGATYATRGLMLELGPAHLTLIRILVLVGVLRVVVRRERLANGVNSLDRLLIIWALGLVLSSVFHTSDAWVFRLGIVWSELGCYFLLRIFIEGEEDLRRVFMVVCVGLLPVAVLMLLEKSLGTNFFAALGGNSDVIVRHGDQIRARGPFTHPILAGTVGATCFAMAIYLWRSTRLIALLGLFAATGVVYAASSSGPMLMVIFVVGGLLIWKTRQHLRAIRWLTMTGIVALDIVMKDPIYFLMARIDISGGSQGWHRARLIQSAMGHFQEWWLAGTDYTRHWMPTGIHANAKHTDITNHILQMGVMGGLPLMLLFLCVLIVAFRTVGRELRQPDHIPDMPKRDGFLIWTLGAILFGHLMNFFSITLFDQSVVFFI